jgi:deoxyribonuclease V
MKIKKLHNWNLSCAQARDLQIQLAEQVRFTAIKKMPKIIAGVDCAFSKDEKSIFAVVVVMKLPDFEIIEMVSVKNKVNFPYIPGLLSFREAPVCLEAIEKLKNTPDCFIIDGQGFAHPRRLGIACHIGLLIGKPTIGCAKSRLIGEYEQPAKQRGSRSPLVDGDEIIGAVVRTRKNVKPVFVSVGHKCTLDDAVKIVLDCSPKYRLPQPSRLAHQLVSKAKLQL